MNTKVRQLALTLDGHNQNRYFIYPNDKNDTGAGDRSAYIGSFRDFHLRAASAYTMQRSSVAVKFLGKPRDSSPHQAPTK